MDDITDDFRLSFLAGTRNLMLDLHCALADIVPSLRLDPWSWPGMTASGHLLCFVGDGVNKMMVLWVHDFSTSGLLPVRLDY